MSVRLRFALLASSSLLLLFFFQLASAQTDPAACSVSCRFVIVPTLGPQGLPGLNGTRGDTGDTGQRGPEGLQGPQGPPGIDGINGTNGIDGIDGKDGINGADGATGTFDLSSTHTGLKLEAPVLTGAISIDGAVLTGSTSVGEGATITAPIIDGAAVIGEGATLAKPTITAPIISDASLTGITTVNRAVIGPDAPTVCQGNTTGTRLNMTIGTFGFAQIGSMIKWADGSVSIIVEAESAQQGTGTRGQINDDAFREMMDCVLYSGRNNFLSSNAFTKDGAPLQATATTSMGQPIIHHDMPGGARVVKLSLEQMNQRNKAVWSFPAPPAVGVDQAYSDTFVGKDMAQTLTNKNIHMTGKLPLLIFGPAIANCVGNHTFDELVVAPPCGFGYGSIGDVIEWEDGTTANIVDTGIPNAQGGTMTATLLKDGGGAVNRTNAAFKVYSSSGPRNNRGVLLSPMVSALTGRLVLRGGLDGYGGSSAVSINMFKMDTGNQRYHARWSFPRPPMDRTDNSWEFFVGEKTIQTLSNKKLTRILGEGTQPTLTLWSGTGTTGTGVATLKSGSNELAGTVVVTIGTGQTAAGNFLSINFATNRHGGPCFVSLTPGNANAAKLSGGAQVYVDVDNATFNGFIIRSPPDTILTSGATYAWTYHVIG